MSSVFEKIDNSLETFLSTLKRFPLASFSAFLLTIIMVTLIDYHDHSNPNAIMASKVAFVSTLGILLFPALQLLGRSWFFPVLGIFLLGGYYYLLPQNLENVSYTIGMRHILMLLSFFLMIFWAPFIFRKSDNDTFWQYAQSIIFGLITAVFFSLLIYAGLSAALFAIEKLFHLEVRGIRYAQMMIVIAGIIGVNFFLSQIPKHPLFLQIRPYSKIKQIFSKNILAPLALIYFVILFSYSAKILFTQTWPSGIVSWIIVAFSLVTIITFLFLSPYLKKSSTTQRLIWLAILLQTLMLGYALWMRVQEYGITYNRYLLAILGVWLLLMSIYFILFGKAQQKWLFFLASVFIFVAMFGQYSANAITQKDQTSRLIKLIETAHPRSEELSMKTKYEISDGLEYIEKHYGVDAFEKIIPHVLTKYKKLKKAQEEKIADANGVKVVPKYDEAKMPYLYKFAPFATHELGFKLIHKWEWINHERNKGKPKSYYFTLDYAEKNILDIREYDWLINFYMYHDKNEPLLINKENNLSIQFKEQHFIIQDNNETNITIELKDFINKLVNTHKEQVNLSLEEMTFKYNDAQTRLKLTFGQINLNDKKEIKDFSVDILLKIKKPKPKLFPSPYLKPKPLKVRNLNKK